MKIQRIAFLGSVAFLLGVLSQFSAAASTKVLKLEGEMPLGVSISAGAYFQATKGGVLSGCKSWSLGGSVFKGESRDYAPVLSQNGYNVDIDLNSYGHCGYRPEAVSLEVKEFAGEREASINLNLIPKENAPTLASGMTIYCKEFNSSATGFRCSVDGGSFYSTNTSLNLPRDYDDSKSYSVDFVMQ